MATIVSYAQNQEDVRLRRGFPEAYQGYYVDVGAGHPVCHSVTKYFYDRGWSGINVEPQRDFFAALCKDRARDTNLAVGVSNQNGSLTLYEDLLVSQGESTFSKPTADRRRALGNTLSERVVPTITLAALCERYVTREIDILKIDVEGHEKETLEGADWGRWRPRVLVIEATQPGRPERCSDRWENLVLAAAYELAVFDGLNCFYVRREDRDLIPSLALAPNVFDDYIPYDHQAAISRLESTLADCRAELAATGAQLAATVAELAATRAELAATGAELAATRAELAATGARLTATRAELAATRDALNALRDHVSDRMDLGPISLGVARALNRLAIRVPALVSLARWLGVRDRSLRGRRPVPPAPFGNADHPK